MSSNAGVHNPAAIVPRQADDGYCCELCGRQSHRKDVLVRHMKIHDRNRAPLKPRRKACVPCAKAKVRCSNEHPSCASCVKRNITCIYEGQYNRLQQPPTPSTNTQSASNSTDEYVSRSTSSEGRTGVVLPSPFETEDRNHEANSNELQPQMSSLLPGNELPFLDYSSGQDLLAGFEAQDVDPTANLDWLFDDNSNGDWFPSPLNEVHFLQERALVFPLLDEMPKSQGRDSISARHAHTGDQFNNLRGELPTPEPCDIPSPDDPWPVDVHPGLTEQLVLPRVGESATRGAPKYFTTRQLSAEDAERLRRCIQLPSQESLWPAVDVEALPNQEILDHCIDLYFAHMHQMFPIIHRPTFNPSESVVVTLAMSSLGVLFGDFQNRQAFSNAMSELTRRLLVYMSERNRRFVRTEAYLTAQLLQGLHGYCSGDERLFELSESCRSSVIHNAKSMGLFRDVEPTSSAPTESVEDSWKEWIQQEKVRRLGWAIYEYDTSIAFLHNGRPHLNISDATLTLPSSMQYWDAPTAYAWASLHPWSNRLSGGQHLKPTIKTLLENTHNMSGLLSNERHRLIIIHTLGRILWSIKEMRSSPLTYLLPDSLHQASQRLINVLDRFIQDPTSLAQAGTGKEMARGVHTTYIIHMMHLYSAGDLMNLFFPILSNVLLRRTAKSESLISSLIQWAEEDPWRVRDVAYHCAQALALTREFTLNLCLEPFHVFYSGILLMVMARLMPAVDDDRHRTAAFHIDHIAGPADPTSIAISNWVRNGGDDVIGIHGVPVLCSQAGYGQVLEETIELLKNMKVWGIAQNLLRVVLKIRQQSLDGSRVLQNPT